MIRRERKEQSDVTRVEEETEEKRETEWQNHEGLTQPRASDLKNLLEISFVSSRVFLFFSTYTFPLSLTMKNHPISKMRGPTYRNPILSFNFPSQLHLHG
jgi:hypothetical protein